MTIYAEAAVIDGCLVHPDQIGLCAEVVAPLDFSNRRHRDAWRDILAAQTAGYFRRHRPGIGYIGLGEYLADSDRWPGAVFSYGTVDGVQVDTRDPVAAAHVVAEAARRRHLAAELAVAADAVAHGSDPAAVLRRLGVIA